MVTVFLVLFFILFPILVIFLCNKYSFLDKIGVDTVIITSVAGICSPPLLPMVSSALKNKEIVITGVVTGNYLGIASDCIFRTLTGQGEKSNEDNTGTWH